MYNKNIMNNVRILKRVVPLLREKEEVVCIPEKNKRDLYSCAFLCVFSVSICFLLLFLTITTLPLSESLIPCIFSFIFLLVFCLMLIFIFNKVVVITNQRLICFCFIKTILLEIENIETVTYDFMQNGLARKTTVIETKDSKSYKIQFYDYKQIKEKLGL